MCFFQVLRLEGSDAEGSADGSGEEEGRAAGSSADEVGKGRGAREGGTDGQLQARVHALSIAARHASHANKQRFIKCT